MNDLTVVFYSGNRFKGGTKMYPKMMARTPSGDSLRLARIAFCAIEAGVSYPKDGRRKERHAKDAANL